MADWVPGAHPPLRRRMFGCEFTYDDITLLQCKGYSFDHLPNPEVFHEKYYDINYWKAQLAFRGASSAGNDMVELIERCIHAELADRMHPRVAVLGIRLAREYASLGFEPDEFSDSEEDDDGAEELDGEWEGGEDLEVYDDIEEVEDGAEVEYEEYGEDDEDMEDYDDDEDEDDGDEDFDFQEIIDGAIHGAINAGGNWSVTYQTYSY